MPLPDAVVAILFDPATPPDVHNALGDALDEAFRKAGIDDTKRADLLRFKLALLLADQAPTTGTPSTDREAVADITQERTPVTTDAKMDNVHRTRADIVRTLGEVFDRIDEWDAAPLGGFAEQLAAAALYAVGVAQGVFNNDLENCLTYYDLLRDALAEMTQGKPGGPSTPAANQNPMLADVHRRCFEMHVRKLVRIYDAAEGNFDHFYKSVVDPENNSAGSSLEDLVLDFHDLKQAVQQFAVLFGVNPGDVYDVPDAEVEHF